MGRNGTSSKGLQYLNVRDQLWEAGYGWKQLNQRVPEPATVLAPFLYQSLITIHSTSLPFRGYCFLNHPFSLPVLLNTFETMCRKRGRDINSWHLYKTRGQLSPCFFAAWIKWRKNQEEHLDEFLTARESPWSPQGQTCCTYWEWEPHWRPGCTELYGDVPGAFTPGCTHSAHWTLGCVAEMTGCFLECVFPGYRGWVVMGRALVMHRTQLPQPFRHTTENMFLMSCRCVKLEITLST